MHGIQKRLLIIVSLFVLTILFIYTVPIGSAVPLKGDIKSFPRYIGEWIGYDISASDSSIPFETPLDVDYSINRMYRSSTGSAILFYIGYIGKFRHNNSIFNGSYVSNSYGWKVLKEKEESKSLDGKIVRIKRALLENEKQCISVAYWYQTGGGAITKRDHGRFHQALDAILNRKTNVALIRVFSSYQVFGNCTFNMEEDLFIEGMLPYLPQFLPF